jgi:ribose transport system permease protein
MKALTLFYRRNRNIVLSYVAMLVLLVAVSLYRPGFGLGSASGLRSLILEAAVIGLVSIGQTFVILTGGIDLSLPWVLSGAAIVTTLLTQAQNEPAIWAIPLVLGLCLLVGLINGLVITYLEVSPVIMTLGMNGILLGAIAGFAGGSAGVQGRYGTPPPFVIDLARGWLVEIPNLAWVLLILGVLGTLLLSFTAFGRRLYAIGTSRQVSLYSGVDLPRMTVLVYMLSAMCSGLAGILLAGKVGRAFLGMGDPYLFISVAAVVIGGSSVLGGSGHLLGTVGGAMFLSVLTATIPVLNLPRAYQLIVFGLVILLAVYFATNRSTREA